MEYHTVAFLDVLGFSALVSKDSEDGLALNLSKFLEVFNAVSSEHGDNLRMFSDSIVVSRPLTPSDLCEVLYISRSLQRSFLARGILLRGGVSFGKHYADARVIYSQALVNAYELESKKARSPRVLVDMNLIDYFVNHPDVDSAMRVAFSELLCRDRDGELFVDYLDHNAIQGCGDALGALSSHFRNLGDPVIEKARWLADYLEFASMRAGVQAPKFEGLCLGFSAAAF